MSTYNAYSGVGDFFFVRSMVVSSPSSFSPSHYTPFPVGAILKSGVSGATYSETIAAVGGTSPYTFAVTGGALPTGTNLNTSTGVISGTPSVVATFTFTIKVTDVNGYTGSYGFEIIIGASPSGGGGAYISIS